MGHAVNINNLKKPSATARDGDAPLNSTSDGEFHAFHSKHGMKIIVGTEPRSSTP
jgi:hypothetical protein